MIEKVAIKHMTALDNSLYESEWRTYTPVKVQRQAIWSGPAVFQQKTSISVEKNVIRMLP